MSKPLVRRYLGQMAPDVRMALQGLDRGLVDMNERMTAEFDAMRDAREQQQTQQAVATLGQSIAGGLQTLGRVNGSRDLQVGGALVGHGTSLVMAAMMLSNPATALCSVAAYASILSTGLSIFEMCQNNRSATTASEVILSQLETVIALLQTIRHDIRDLRRDILLALDNGFARVETDLQYSRDQVQHFREQFSRFEVTTNTYFNRLCQRQSAIAVAAGYEFMTREIVQLRTLKEQQLAVANGVESADSKQVMKAAAWLQSGAKRNEVNGNYAFDRACEIGDDELLGLLAKPAISDMPELLRLAVARHLNPSHIERRGDAINPALWLSAADAYLFFVNQTWERYQRHNPLAFLQSVIEDGVSYLNSRRQVHYLYQELAMPTLLEANADLMERFASELQQCLKVPYQEKVKGLAKRQVDMMKRIGAACSSAQQQFDSSRASLNSQRHCTDYHYPAAHSINFVQSSDPLMAQLATAFEVISDGRFKVSDEEILSSDHHMPTLVEPRLGGSYMPFVEPVSMVDRLFDDAATKALWRQAEVMGLIRFTAVYNCDLLDSKQDAYVRREPGIMCTDRTHTLKEAVEVSVYIDCDFEGHEGQRYLLGSYQLGLTPYQLKTVQSNSHEGPTSSKEHANPHILQATVYEADGRAIPSMPMQEFNLATDGGKPILMETAETSMALPSFISWALMSQNYKRAPKLSQSLVDGVAVGLSLVEFIDLLKVKTDDAYQSFMQTASAQLVETHAATDRVSLVHERLVSVQSAMQLKVTLLERLIKTAVFDTEDRIKTNFVHYKSLLDGLANLVKDSPFEVKQLQGRLFELNGVLGDQASQSTLKTSDQHTQKMKVTIRHLCRLAIDFCGEDPAASAPFYEYAAHLGVPLDGPRMAGAELPEIVVDGRRDAPVAEADPAPGEALIVVPRIQPGMRAIIGEAGVPRFQRWLRPRFDLPRMEIPREVRALLPFMQMMTHRPEELRAIVADEGDRGGFAGVMAIADRQPQALPDGDAAPAQ